MILRQEVIKSVPTLLIDNFYELDAARFGSLAVVHFYDPCFHSILDHKKFCQLHSHPPFAFSLPLPWHRFTFSAFSLGSSETCSSLSIFVALSLSPPLSLSLSLSLSHTHTIFKSLFILLSTSSYLSGLLFSSASLSLYSDSAWVSFPLYV